MKYKAWTRKKELRKACRVPNAKFDNVTKILDDLITKYETSCHGPEKWQKLTTYLRQSLEGLLVDLSKKQIDQIASHGKRAREDNDHQMSGESVHDMDTSNKVTKRNKRSKSENSPLKPTHPEDGRTIHIGDDENREKTIFCIVCF